MDDVRYGNRLLDTLRQEGDPIPDALIAAVVARGETSAVWCYAATKGVKALGFTYRLHHDL